MICTRRIGNVVLLGGPHLFPRFHDAIRGVIASGDFDVIGLEYDESRANPDIFDVQEDTIDVHIWKDTQVDRISSAIGAEYENIPVSLIDTAYEEQDCDHLCEEDLLKEIGKDSLGDIGYSDLENVCEFSKREYGKDEFEKRDERMRQHIKWLSEEFEDVLVVCGASHICGLSRYKSSEPKEASLYKPECTYIDDFFFDYELEELEELIPSNAMTAALSPTTTPDQ